MKRATGLVAASAIALVVSALWIARRFESDIKAASAKAAVGSVLVNTSCGPIEYQEAGTGTPLLMVHGSGGGHDQGMAFAGKLAQRGIRVIAVSRFGYLRTPMPADAAPESQADAHVCLLDVLSIANAVVAGGADGGPSALQIAIRHPDRVSALVLLVPLAYKPSTSADSAEPLAPWAEALLMRLIGSDFLFWAGLHMARDQVIKCAASNYGLLGGISEGVECALISALTEPHRKGSALELVLRDFGAGFHSCRFAVWARVEARWADHGARSDRRGSVNDHYVARADVARWQQDT